MEIFLFLVVIGLIPAMIAAHKGRSFVLWWIYGVALFLIALVHSILAAPADTRSCPHCAERVKNQAVVCPHCQRDLEPLQADDGTQSRAILVLVLLFLAGMTAWVLNVSLSSSKSTSDAKASQLASPASTPTLLRSHWERYAADSAFAGKNDIRYEREAIGSIGTGINRDEHANLAIGCFKGVTRAYIDFKTYLGIDSTTILYRIDGKQPRRQKWRISTDFKAAFAPGAIGLIRELRSGQDFSVRVTPYGESPIEVIFALDGVDAVAADIAKRCGWKG